MSDRFCERLSDHLYVQKMSPSEYIVLSSYHKICSVLTRFHLLDKK